MYAVPTGAIRSSATGLAGSEAGMVEAEGLAGSAAAIVGEDLRPSFMGLSSRVAGKEGGGTALGAGAC